MVKPITLRQLTILQFVGKHPGVGRDALVRSTQASTEDMKYLEENDLIREREDGRCHVSHFGELVLRRG